MVPSAKQQTVLNLYAGDLVTTGEAAAMFGLTRIQFLDVLHQTGVGYRVELDEQDFQMLRQWREGH